MDRRWMDRNTHQDNDDSQSDYDVVENLEASNLHVPARPINQDNEYADRDVPRSCLAPGPPAVSTSMNSIHRRKNPPTSGPAVNRELKPGRRAKSTFNIHVAPADKRSTPVQPGNWHSSRPSPSPVRDLPALSVHQPSRKEGASEKDKFSQHTRGLWSPERFLEQSETQRLCLDLETHDKHKRAPERAVEYLQHEWPPRKEDRQNFGALEKLQQVHAKNQLEELDGAFLVRDSSINTNSEPLVLAVYHKKKVYNIKIRFLEESSKYALGTGLQSNDMFNSVTDMIRFHCIYPIILVSGRNVPGSRYPESFVLTCPVTRSDVDLQ